MRKYNTLAVWPRRLLGSGSLLALALTSSAMTPARAQSTQPASKDETVIVTGTREQSRTTTTSLAPVDVIGAGDLAKSGDVSLRDMVTSAIPSASGNTTGSGPSFVVRTMALRGLGSDQTLVLVNGKRRHTTAIIFATGATQNGQSPVDLDLIPTDAIGHIEVLRDGASAQYGSDALAGVVNIILKQDKEGGSAWSQYGADYKGDGRTASFGASIGFPVAGNGSLTLSADVRFAGRTNRAYTPNMTEFYFLLNGTNQPVATTAPGAVFDPNAILPVGLHYDPRELTANRHPGFFGDPAVDLYSFGFDGDKPITSGIDFYTFGTVSVRHASAYQTFRTPNSINNDVFLTPDGFNPRIYVSDVDFQVASGLKGDDLLGMHWDLSTTVGRSDVTYNSQSENASFGASSPTNFYLGNLQMQEWTTNLDLTREVKTGLFANPTFIAGGLEYRQNQFTQNSGEYAAYANGGYMAPSGPLAGILTPPGAQGTGGFPPSAQGVYQRNNIGVYLNAEQTFTENWDASISGRFENYSDFGAQETAQFSSRYEFIPGYALRGTISDGFRAPSLQQEHYINATSQLVSTPLGRILYPVQLLPASNPAAAALGATPLKPEKSTNYSLGLVASAFEGFTATIDAYQIQIANRILQTSTLGPSTQISNILAAQGLNSQQAVYFYGNLANTTTRGMDFVFDYRTDLDELGQLKLTLSGNFNQTKIDRLNTPANAPVGVNLFDRTRIADITEGNPRNKFIFGVDWLYEDFDSTLTVTKYGGVTQRAVTAVNDEVVDPGVLADLNIGYNITPDLKFSVGARNLFNAFPTKVTLANSGNYLTYNNYSPFGVDGGMYYIRLDTKF